MPHMNGFELAKQIRQGSQIPLIMLTVRSEEEDVIRALGLGADDFLTKPFSPRILIARIRALLRRVGMEAEGTLKQPVYRLRQKLERDPAEPTLLRTVPHSGYLIDRDGIPE
jgi:DNA-binding response OmpR family regulator